MRPFCGSAAYAIERDAELHSHDSDVARFPDLRWIDPLTRNASYVAGG
jgi:predicted nucleic acid-binding protein